MSDNILKLIPTDPTWPGPDQDTTVAAAAALLAPHAAAITVERSEEIRFVDAGANFERVVCPYCQTELDSNWWSNQMDRADTTQFEHLDTITPCCHTPASLNDLTYQWPQGFARWTLLIHNPARPPLADHEIAELAAAADHPLRQIWAHY